MAKGVDEVIQEVVSFLKAKTDVESNPDLKLIVHDGELGKEIAILSEYKIISIRPEKGTKGRRFVLNVYYGTGEDLLSKEERAKDSSRVVRGNDYLYWGHDGSLLGFLFYTKADQAKAYKGREDLLNLLKEWIEEVSV